MCRKKNTLVFRLQLQVEYSDGSVESSFDFAENVHKRFHDFVSKASTQYLVGFREIRVLDAANRVFKSYTQHL